MLKQNKSPNRLLFVLSAPSGTGKTTLCNRVVKELPGIIFSISHTTRPPRQGEKDGENYYFITREEFEKHISENMMAEWAEVYGNFYGTSKQTIAEAFEKGLDIIFDIDEQGAKQLCSIYPNVVTILVLPPSMKALEERLAGRGTDTKDTVIRRLQKAREETEKMSWYSYVVVNDNFEEALANIKAVVMAERCKNNHFIIEELLNE